jgi:hypothetical protein
VEGSVGVRETIELALRLHPDTTAVAVIEARRNFWWKIAHSELLRHDGEVREIDILDLQAPGRLRALPHSLPIP